MRSLWFNLLILVLVALLTACGTLEVGMAHTPTPDHATTATAAASAIAHRATQIAASVTSAALATDHMATQLAAMDTPTIAPAPTLYPHLTLTLPPLPSPTPAPLPTAAAPLSGRLVCGSAGEIWIVERGQSPRVLVTGARRRNPHLSPTGDRFLFFRPNPEWLHLSDLWLADFTCPAAPAPCQVNERRLVGPAEVGGPLIYGLAWSPDGRTVALTTGSDAKHFYSEDLWLVDVETGDYRQVLNVSDGGGVPDYSPDGAWIALSLPYTGYQQGRLSLIAADGSGYRPLFDQLIHHEERWLPSGVLVVDFIQLTREEEIMTELWQVPVVGEPVRLAIIPAAARAHSFCWSADGRRVAYLVDDPAGWLHIARADDSGPAAVPGTDERTRPCSWSPGGQFLAVTHDGQYFFVPDGPDPALIPMPAPLRLWLDDDSCLATE
jgi:hypothetical protein